MYSVITAPLSTEMAKLTAMMSHLHARTSPLKLFGAIDVLVRSPLPPVVQSDVLSNTKLPISEVVPSSVL